MDTETIFCSNCHNDIPNTTWNLHTVVCVRHNYYCEECGQTIRKKNREKHEHKVHLKVLCKCGKTLEVQEMNTHQQYNCPKRLEPCIFCNCPLQFCSLSKHEEECGSRTEQCDQCNKWVQFRNQSSHICSPLNIDNELIICPYCLVPMQDHMFLQEHIFNNHPEVID